MSSIKSVVGKVDRGALTNNTQRVALKLLGVEGQWVSRKVLGRVASSATARVRDLRKVQFGNFTVECRSAKDLKKRGSRNDFFYRINPRTVSQKQVKTVFRV